MTKSADKEHASPSSSLPAYESEGPAQALSVSKSKNSRYGTSEINEKNTIKVM